ncbi:hypothetical protein NM688_g6267 [Phlebia brevispora]|uniref:Uncharacterized protein n=1 Tax=Phlebia brevispora TaxID=194682 RepID=A0ACC1SHZ6_9APHY|nr:hypothetical protein NM688_g6267 [Phlebia brevispora]
MNTKRKVKGSRPVQLKHTKRSLFTLDTAVSSYDRTDPFTALNVLRRLISSLPTRLGGCQYKLTPDEHKLSMHLLAIVEPFVGHAHSRRSLTYQPTELLDEIVFHLDSKRDLLSLALSCKRMHSVIFPRHFEYRVVRAKVSSIGLWNHLIVNRALARNVRVLEIVDERCTEPLSLPSDVSTTDTDMESSDDELGMHVKQERYLVSALTKMTCLDAFVWSCNHSPMSIEQVWPTLLKSQSLRDIDISDNLVFAASGEPEEEETSTKPRKRQAVVSLLTVVLEVLAKRVKAPQRENGRAQSNETCVRFHQDAVSTNGIFYVEQLSQSRSKV